MTTQPTDRFDLWRAPAHWQTVDIISDLHLQAAEPATFERWRALMERPASAQADALVILGDFFEVWAGDDLLNDKTPSADGELWRSCVDILHRYSLQRPLFFMHGNRDFLVGTHALDATGMTLLNDPTVLELQGQRYLLSHGDALCLADTDYQAFRKLVRSPAWQADFLARSLTERLAITRDLRERSEAKKQAVGSDPTTWADVDATAARNWLQSAKARTLIHGHTHRPAEHDLGEGLERWVLSDWDASASPPRAQVLRLSAQGLQRLPG